MTKQEKTNFINELVDGVKRIVLSKVEEMPESWDGHELRKYIKQTFAEVDFNTLKGKRLKEYVNDVYVRNL